MKRSRSAKWYFSWPITLARGWPSRRGCEPMGGRRQEGPEDGPRSCEPSGGGEAGGAGWVGHHQGRVGVMDYGDST